MAYVYSHTRLDTNEVFYIGIGSTSNHQRAYIKANRKDYWKRIVNKYGYKVDIIEDNISLEEACEREKYYISLYGRKDLGKGLLVNFTNGGENNSGGKRNQEFKDNVSKRMSGFKFSLESKLKMRNSALGRRYSEEVYKKCARGHFKLVLDTVTGIYYESCKEAAELLDINKVTLIHYLTGRLKNKTNLIYV